MKSKESLPLHAHTLNLYKGEFERLQELFPKIGASRVIRRLVHNLIDKIDKSLDLNSVSKISNVETSSTQGDKNSK